MEAFKYDFSGRQAAALPGSGTKPRENNKFNHGWTRMNLTWLAPQPRRTANRPGSHARHTLHNTQEKFVRFRAIHLLRTGDGSRSGAWVAALHLKFLVENA